MKNKKQGLKLSSRILGGFQDQLQDALCARKQVYEVSCVKIEHCEVKLFASQNQNVFVASFVV